ncbi:hypothetical protein ACJJIW_11620 [Microbulbifer sp. JMSA004]|uniref:hypothetical protein n=1 Tax=unclassified Microbulbifer TaxID=2619833 RepID=UPI00403B0482
MPKGLPFQLDHYLALVDWSGRHLAPQKRGAISLKTPLILERLGISAKHWLYLGWHFESRFKGLVGSAEIVKQAYIQFDKRWVHEIGIAGVPSQPHPANLLLPQILYNTITTLLSKIAFPKICISIPRT